MTRSTDAALIAQMGAGGGSGGDPADLMRQTYDHSDSLTNNHYTSMAWVEYTGPGAGLNNGHPLDLTGDPTAPTITKSAVYSVTATINVVDLHDDKLIDLWLDAVVGSELACEAFTSGPLDTGAPEGIVGPSVSFTRYLPEGTIITASVHHNVGSTLNVTSQFLVQEIAAGGGTGGTGIPIAAPTHSSIDSTSYVDTTEGSGTQPLITLVGDDTGTPGVAMAESGDAHVQLVLGTTGIMGLYLGDGTFDPTSDGANIYYHSGALRIENYGSSGRISLRANDEIALNSAVVTMPDLPTSDPLENGQLWNNSGVLTISAG